MEKEIELITRLSSIYPVQSALLANIVPFALSGHIPPFIYVTDHLSPRLSTLAITSALDCVATIRNTGKGNGKEFLRFACVDAIECFTPRLFYDTVLNAFAKWQPDWDEGCSNWGGAEGARWNESVGTFVQGLQALLADIAGRDGEETDPESACRLVFVIENAERLKGNIPELVIPLTRLAELVGVTIISPEMCC